MTCLDDNSHLDGWEAFDCNGVDVGAGDRVRFNGEVREVAEVFNSTLQLVGLEPAFIPAVEVELIP